VPARSEISGMLLCGGRKKIGLSQRLKTLWRGYPLCNGLKWRDEDQAVYAGSVAGFKSKKLDTI
jgi:hypothetical protein